MAAHRAVHGQATHGRTARSRFPAATLLLIAAALACEALPQLAVHCAFERAKLPSEPWRLLTGHLVHGFSGLLLLDLAALALLGAWVERRSRRAFVWVALCGGLAASLALLFLTSLERYVGSSALATALLVNGAVVALRTRPRSLEARLASATLVLLAAKILLEALGRWPAALGSLPEGIEPVAVAHMAGGLAGWALALGEGRAGLGNVH